MKWELESFVQIKEGAEVEMEWGMVEHYISSALCCKRFTPHSHSLGDLADGYVYGGSFQAWPRALID